MKAIVCSQFGSLENLTIEQVDDPTVSDDSVLINILAAGVNFPDALLVQGKYQMKPELPFVPGMELCGEITETGKNVAGFSTGDRVIANTASFGAFAEKIVLPATNVIKIPHTINPSDACNLLVAHGTAHHALKQRATLKPGETLVVLGASGGTGLAAVQIGKAMGAKVIAAASTSEKLNVATDNGADHTINYSTENIKDSIKQLTGGRGADVIYDPVGGEVFDSSVRAMAPDGRFLVIGFASGTIPKFPTNLALVKEVSLVGVFWGAFVKRQPDVFANNMSQLFDWYQSGEIAVRTDTTFTLEETADALRYVMDRKVKGKVAIVVSQ